MPMYEYQCPKCEHIVEVLQRHDEPGPKRCPNCGGRKMARVMSNTSFQLVGSGWYKTDYSSSSSSGGGESSGD